MLHREAPIDKCRCLQQEFADQHCILEDTEWEIAMNERVLIAERELAVGEKLVQAVAGRQYERLDKSPNTDPLDLTRMKHERRSL